MEMYAAVWSGYFRELSPEEGISLLHRAGFTHTEITITTVTDLLERGDPEKTGLKFANWLQDIGVSAPQGHLNFKKGICTQEGLDDLKRELTLFSSMGIQNAVLHFNGGNEMEPMERMEARLEGVRQLQSFVKGSDLYLCLENLGSVPETHTVERLNGIIDTLGGDHLGICLDTGHLHLVNGRAEVTQTQAAFITGAGERLRALHITENNGHNDDHQMPYSARYGIDWVEVLRTLRQIGYRGLFNLEILGEREAPLPVKWAKLDYIKTLTDYMLSDEFIE